MKIRQPPCCGDFTANLVSLYSNACRGSGIRSTIFKEKKELGLTACYRAIADFLLGFQSFSLYVSTHDENNVFKFTRHFTEVTYSFKDTTEDVSRLLSAGVLNSMSIEERERIFPFCVSYDRRSTIIRRLIVQGSNVDDNNSLVFSDCYHWLCDYFKTAMIHFRVDLK